MELDALDTHTETDVPGQPRAEPARPDDPVWEAIRRYGEEHADEIAAASSEAP